MCHNTGTHPGHTQTERRRERERSEVTLFGNLSLSLCLSHCIWHRSETFDLASEIPIAAQSALSERPESDVLIFPTHRVPERRARGDSGATAQAFTNTPYTLIKYSSGQVFPSFTLDHHSAFLGYFSEACRRRSSLPRAIIQSHKSVTVYSTRSHLHLRLYCYFLIQNHLHMRNSLIH